VNRHPSTSLAKGLCKHKKYVHAVWTQDVAKRLTNVIRKFNFNFRFSSRNSNLSFSSVQVLKFILLQQNQYHYFKFDLI